MNFKKPYKRGLALFLSLILALSLAVPGLAVEEAKELPKLDAPTKEELATPPTDEVYKKPYDEAKEADELDGENLGAVNGQIQNTVDTANEEIGEANTAAGNAAAEANDQVEGINEEIANANDAAKAAADEANSFAEQAKDGSLSLDERKEAADKAEEAAAAAEAAAKKADEQVTAAQGVVDAAQKALEDAQKAYQDAIDKANALLDGNDSDPGLKAQAEKLINDATGKVNDAKESLKTAEAAFAAVEGARSRAWDASEAARIAADAAKVAAEGKQEFINTAKGTYGDGIAESPKMNVDRDADAAISAKELENAAKDVVDAQTKVNDLQKLDKLTTAKDELEQAKAKYDEADKALNGYTDEDGEHVPGAQEIAQTAKDNLRDQVDDGSAVIANSWLDNHYADFRAHNYRAVVNAVLANDDPEWLTEEMVQKVISDAKNHTHLTQGGEYIVKLGNTMEALRSARSELATQESALSSAVKNVQTSTGATGNSAQDVLTNLTASIDQINTNGKYDSDLEDLTTAIETAGQALDTAKSTYTGKGGTADVSDIQKAQNALSAASEAYSDAIDALNATLKDSKLTTDTTIEMLNTLKAQKAAVEQAKDLLAEVERTAGAYTTAQETYDTAEAAAQSANNQYEAAKKAVEDAEKNLEAARVNDASLTSADWNALTEALAKAQQTLTDATAAKNAADEEVAKAKQDAEDAKDAYEDALENANNPGTDPENPGTDPENPGTTPEVPGGVTTIPDTDVPLGDGTGAGDVATLEDQEVPLAGLISREILVSYLYTHEGSPDGEDAEGEYTLALAWAVANDIMDEEDDPEEVVTVAILRDVMTRYAEFLGVVFDIEIEGEDDMIVMNCGEILAAFYARIEEQEQAA